MDLPRELVSGFLGGVGSRLSVNFMTTKKCGGVWGAAPVPAVKANKLFFTE
jgi:hypothetical protein